MKSDAEIRQDLSMAQVIHLKYLEEFTDSLPALNGVNIAQCCNYDTIQELNHLFLMDYLGGDIAEGSNND